MHRREPPEGEEDTFEFTEEEQEEGPEPLSAAESDAEVLGGAAWTPLFSSAAEHVKWQVAGEPCFARTRAHALTVVASSWQRLVVCQQCDAR